jgi:sugar transferase (PEP-CTERM/EpsH1 system associated)
VKILWVKTDFLHPTTRGGQIRTLEMVKRLHARHQVHYLAFDDPQNPEGLRRAGEYSTKQYAVPHTAPPRGSIAFAGQVVKGFVSSLPVAVSRWTSSAMRRRIAELMRAERFDAVVCDFLAPAANFEDPSQYTLFQHNVETVIWQRHAQTASDPLRKAYFALQAKRMFDFERAVCQAASSVVAVSEADACTMRTMFGLPGVSFVPTGVDVGYFTPAKGTAEDIADLVFVGSMDWMPNSDGILWFAREVFPLIRAKKPACRLAIVGRQPGPEIRALAEDPFIRVTGTVPDVRPYLWGSKVSIVPLRIGGGTRLKIYEAMAARTPVVSTAVGAEGLAVESPTHIRFADEPAVFADACLELLDDAAARKRIADAAWHLVYSQFSWDHAVQRFEEALGIPAPA